MPSSGANGSLPFVATDVVFRPSDFAGTITNDWATVSLCTTDFAPYGDKAVDHLNQIHNTTNFAKGIGDICRYMGVVDGSSWRIPTAAEWEELYGSDQTNGGQSAKLGNGWMTGSYYPLSGYAMGLEQSGVKITGSGADATVIGASKIDGAVFLPASGLREYTNGAIGYIGSGSWCWSSTAFTHANSLLMQFTSSNVWPQASNPRNYAFTVRCIRE